MTNDSDVEQRILNEATYDELLRRKIEAQVAEERQAAKSRLKRDVVTAVAKIPSGLMFTANTEWALFNRKAATESVINGVQLESFLGLDMGLIERVKSGALASFIVGDYYIAFLRGYLALA